MKEAIIIPPVCNIALVVGHNEDEQGAKNFLGETEYLFNRRIAMKLREQINVPVFLRPSGASYKEQVGAIVSACERFKIKETYHLHFNSFNSKVQGVEALIGPSSTVRNNNVAQIFCQAINEEFGTALRGVKRVSTGHAGFYMLNALEEIAVSSIILEPVFGDEKQSKEFFLKEDRYVQILTKLFSSEIGR